MHSGPGDAYVAPQGDNVHPHCWSRHGPCLSLSLCAPGAVCVGSCVCARVCVCACVRVCACACACACGRVRASVRVSMHVGARACMRARTQDRERAGTCAQACTYAPVPPSAPTAGDCAATPLHVWCRDWRHGPGRCTWAAATAPGARVVSTSSACLADDSVTEWLR